MILAKVYITLKNGVLDPQGMAISNSLSHMGFDCVDEVRQGKMIAIKLNVTDKKIAQEQVESMCKKLLVNNVVENYSFELSELELVG